MRPRGLAFAGLLVVSAAIAQAGRQPLVDEGAVRRFLGELQRSVASEDRGAVSRLMHYPLTVWAAGVRIPIPDSAALLQNYDAVFSPALKAVIARAELPHEGRPAPAVPVTMVPDGAVIHGNTITIERIGDALRITRLSVPLAPVAREHGNAPSKSSSAVKSPREPTRIVMGLRMVQLSGFLAEGERESYLIWANKNQLLEVRVTGVPHREIVARIVRLETQAPVDALAREGARTWIGRVPEHGEYRIDVVRLTRGREPLPYGLRMRLR